LIAKVAQHHLGGFVTSFFGATWSVVVELILMGLVIALPFIPWRRLVRHRDERSQ